MKGIIAESHWFWFQSPINKTKYVAVYCTVKPIIGLQSLKRRENRDEAQCIALVLGGLNIVRLDFCIKSFFQKVSTFLLVRTTY